MSKATDGIDVGVSEYVEEYADKWDIDLHRALLIGGVEITNCSRRQRFEECAEASQDFISTYDYVRAAIVEQKGIDHRIEAYNDGETFPKITFPNERLALLWIEEVVGQISDGMWENSGVDWEQYANLCVEVDPARNDVSVTETIYHADRVEFADLIDSEGLMGRMMFYLRAGLGCDEDEYSFDDMEEDIRLLDTMYE